MEKGLNFFLNYDITKEADFVNTNPADIDKQNDSEKEEEKDPPFDVGGCPRSQPCCGRDTPPPPGTSKLTSPSLALIGSTSAAGKSCHSTSPEKWRCSGKINI